MTSSTNCNSSGGLMTSKKNSVSPAEPSVSSVVIPAATSPPCSEQEDDDAEDYDNDNIASKITYISYI